VNDRSITEGNSGTANMAFTITLTGATERSVTVSFATADGTAVAGSDYTATSGTRTFSPGQTTATFTVPIVGDTVHESTETFTVNLSSPVRATIADGQGVGTILDNDP
jgi:hypothetical protein